MRGDELPVIVLPVFFSIDAYSQGVNAQQKLRTFLVCDIKVIDAVHF